MKCPVCGKNIPKGSFFCNHCGEKIEVENATAANAATTDNASYNPKQKIKVDNLDKFILKKAGAEKKRRKYKSKKSLPNINPAVLNCIKWIVGFRSKNALCAIIAIIWYIYAVFAAKRGEWTTFFGMLAFAYIAAGIIKYKKYDNSLYIILIGTICFFAYAAIGRFQPAPDTDTTIVAQTTAATATAAPTLTSEESEKQLEEAKENLSESWNELKESVGIETKEKPEDRPFNPSEYTSAPSYEELARYPDHYENGMYKFYGEVLSVSEGIFNTALRLQLNDDFNQVIYCEVPNEMLESRRILEHDFITIYGVSKGTTTYTTVLGARLTVPKIRVTQWMM